MGEFIDAAPEDSSKMAAWSHKSAAVATGQPLFDGS
jgi:hypothetical protein